MKIEIRLLKKEDDRSNLSCREPALDSFFQKFAGQNHFKHFIGTPYVPVSKERVLGFASVSAVIVVMM